MKKIYNQIGLCYAAKKVVFGTDNITAGMKKKKVSLVIISSDASFNTQKLIQDKAKTYGIKVMLLNEFDDQSISSAIGKDNIKVIGIKDKGFSRMIIKNVKGE